MKRTFYAWCLLAVSVSHWIGGHICFEVSYYIEVQRQMDETEQAIAAELKAEEGLEGRVKVLPETPEAPRGHIYSDFFVFSTELDHHTIYYTLEDDSRSGTYEKVTGQQQPPSRDAGKTALLKSLFKEFMMPGPDFPAPGSNGRLISSFFYPTFHSLFNPFIPTPPPDVAC